MLISFFLDKNFRAISPVPVARSRTLSEFFNFDTVYILSFHNLCKPKDIASFIKSYLFETELNISETNFVFFVLRTFVEPKLTFSFILTFFPFYV